MSFLDELQDELQSSEDMVAFIEECKSVIQEESPLKAMPVNNIRWVNLDEVKSNEYNPNSVAKQELKLLQLSILNDGYTQPVVTIWDEALEKYVIIDGFHRYYCCVVNKEIRERTGGRLPIVVLNKTLADRMASTVRHNRARGKHSVEGMSDLVFKMLEQGMVDEEICNELGMEPEELIKLKHLTGFSKLFEGVKYKQSWMAARQIKLQQEYEKSQEGEVV